MSKSSSFTRQIFWRSWLQDKHCLGLRQVKRIAASPGEKLHLGIKLPFVGFEVKRDFPVILVEFQTRGLIRRDDFKILGFYISRGVYQRFGRLGSVESHDSHERQNNDKSGSWAQTEVVALPNPK